MNSTLTIIPSPRIKRIQLSREDIIERKMKWWVLGGHGKKAPSFIKLHTKPKTVAWFLGFRYTYSGTISDTGSYGEIGCTTNFGHFIVISRGLSQSERLHTAWHEIAHGLDWTVHNGGAHRICMEGDVGQYSDRLAPLLEEAKVILMEENVYWSSLPACIAGQAFESRRTLGGNGNARPSQYESPAERFAEAVAISVLNPDFMKEKFPKLHLAITKILREELNFVLPEAAVEAICGRM